MRELIKTKMLAVFRAEEFQNIIQAGEVSVIGLCHEIGTMGRISHMTRTSRCGPETQLGWTEQSEMNVDLQAIHKLPTA